MASLSDTQFDFLQDVYMLLACIMSQGWKVTFGEVARPIEMQEIYVRTGRSKTMNSQHIPRLAIDLNFFKPTPGGGTEYVCTKEAIQGFGDYWEGLNPKNSWGGNWNSFKDTPHFQRRR
ncbi:hypothetical protein LCGC14_1169970 [marine sediment metagenome]|uniref:Peptidase M15C domain-containing protein n=1 Tax=marine sediment metagenome TaxID=412755 RepID=A0A0F9LV06_9ZZZZ